MSFIYIGHFKRAIKRQQNGQNKHVSFDDSTEMNTKFYLALAYSHV